MTGELPDKSYMLLELFRSGDLVTPTYGLLRGLPGTIVQVKITEFGSETVVIRFNSPVKKYSRQEAKIEWAYEPENVRLEGLAMAKV